MKALIEEVLPAALLAEYRAVREGAAVFARADRRFLRVHGKAPADMLKGVITGRIPSPLPPAGVSPRPGEVAYSAVLTPKGKMVTDLRVFGGETASGFLLELPSAGFEAARQLLGRVMPPRLARVDVVHPQPLFLTLAGPRGPSLLSRWLAGRQGGEGSRRDAGGLEEGLRALKEGEALWFSLPGGEALTVTSNLHRPDLAWDVVVLAPSEGEELPGWLLEGGAVPLSPGTWAVLEVEGGRPVFGEDMDENTLPMEAGIQDRAIDHTKGCYTGQEVVVRVRDRGHVNRRLVGLLLGRTQPLPSRGAPLFLPGGEKEVGWVTRAVWSPAFGQGAALGYLRREVGGGEEVRLIDPQGAPAQVVELGPRGWSLGRDAGLGLPKP